MADARPLPGLVSEAAAPASSTTALAESVLGREPVSVAQRKERIRQMQEQHGSQDRRAAQRRLAKAAQDTQQRAAEASSIARAAPDARSAAEASPDAETRSMRRAREELERLKASAGAAAPADDPYLPKTPPRKKERRERTPTEKTKTPPRPRGDGAGADARKPSKASKKAGDGRKEPRPAKQAREKLVKGLELAEKPAAPTFLGEAETLLAPGREKREVVPKRRCAYGACCRTAALVCVVFLAGVYFDELSNSRNSPPRTEGRRGRDATAAPTAAPAAPTSASAALIRGSSTASTAAAAARTLAPSPAKRCAATDWVVTEDGVREACSRLGDLDAFVGWTLDEARETCCADADCAGFSYDNATRSGSLLRDVGCGVDRRPGWTGHAKVSALYDDDGFVANENVVPSAAATTSASSDCLDEGWVATAGGYREACGGDAGNLGGFSSLSLREAKFVCCHTTSCAGFSFDNATGNGVLKRDASCGFVSSDVYDGYSLPASGTRGGSQQQRGGGG